MSEPVNLDAMAERYGLPGGDPDVLRLIEEVRQFRSTALLPPADAVNPDDEPEEYQILTSVEFRECDIAGVTRTFGYCVNSPTAGGYCDDRMLWVADNIADPGHFVEVLLHEATHARFPHLSEDDVRRVGADFRRLVVGAFTGKGVPLPRLPELYKPRLFDWAKTARGSREASCAE